MGYLIELDDIGVSNLLEDLDLPRDALYVLLVFDLVFLQDFHSNLKLMNYIRSTFSPVRVWVASLTFPKVPLPNDFPIRGQYLYSKRTKIQ